VIKRLPRFAEVTLQRLCAAQDALCQEVGEDESGWDYLIEFPEPGFTGPADMRPPRKSAYVQVKSARRGSLTCRIKLSNALRSAQSHQPWFVVLMIEDGAGDVAVYAEHVWEGHIRRVLEAARRAHNAGKPLHKQMVTFRLDGTRRNGDLIKWMQDTIAAVGDDYEQRKKELFKTVGFESGYGNARLTIEASSVEEISRNFLGLGRGLPLTQFDFTPSRFGISSGEPLMSLTEGIVHIEPVGQTGAEIRLRGSDRSEPIILAARAYATPESAPEDKTYRFSADFFEMIWSPKGDSSCTATLPLEEKRSLSDIEAFARMRAAFDAGSVDAQVWLHGKRAIAGSLTVNNPKASWDWQKLAQTLKLLRSIAGLEQEKHLRVSIKDLSAAPGLKTFQEVLSAPNFRLEFKANADAPTALTSLLYHFTVEVGGYLFSALVELEVAEDVTLGERRRVTARSPRFIESYVLANPTDGERRLIVEDYDRHLASREADASPMPLGDLREFIESIARERAAALPEER